MTCGRCAGQDRGGWIRGRAGRPLMRRHQRSTPTGSRGAEPQSTKLMAAFGDLAASRQKEKLAPFQTPDLRPCAREARSATSR